MMSGKSKSNKLLGLQIEDLLMDCCREQAKGALRGDAFPKFWDQATNKMSATTFLADMLVRLVSTVEKSVPIGVDVYSLVNTIAFITFFLDVNVHDARIKKFFENWSKQEKPLDVANKHPSARDIVKTLQLRVEEKSPDQWSQVILSVITLHSSEIFQMLVDPVEHPTWPEEVPPGGEGAFLYPYLKSACASSTSQSLVLDKLLIQALAQPKQMSLNPKVAESSILALVHICKQILAHTPVAEPDKLKRLLQHFQPFFSWPKPISHVTTQLLLTIKQEMLTPGSAMRAALAADAKMGQIPGFTDALGQDARPLWYIMEDGDLLAGGLASILQVTKFDTFEEKNGLVMQTRRIEPDTMSTVQQAMVVMHAMRADLGLTDAEAALFGRLPPAHIANLHRDALRFIDNAATLAGNDAAKAKAERARLLETMKKSLSIFASKDPLVQLPNPLPEQYLPTPQPFAHLYVPIKLDYNFMRRDETGSMGSTDAPVPSTPLYTKLDRIVSFYTGADSAVASAEPANPATATFIVAGSNDVLHSFLCSYIFMLQSRPEAARMIAPKFLLIPLGRGDHSVANYLARYDSWYCRHIYLPFRTPTFMLPWVSVNEMPDSDGSELYPPGKFYRSLVEQYAREATGTLRMNVWVCEGWQPTAGGSKSRKDAPDHAIPFLTRCEIGVGPDAREYAKKKSLPPDMSVEDITKDKGFVFNPPEVKVAFQRVNMNGAPVDTVTDEPAPYQSLLLSAVPKKGDKTCIPKPSDPWLEMYAQAAESAKGKQRLRKNVLLADARQHVDKLTLSCGGEESFYVRVDGRNFGPYQKVNIQRMADPSTKQPMEFPVQVFFPLDN